VFNRAVFLERVRDRPSPPSHSDELSPSYNPVLSLRQARKQTWSVRCMTVVHRTDHVPNAGHFRIAVAFALVLLATLGPAQPATATDPWRPLHRPLDLPRLAPGDPCPVSPIDQRVDWDRINIFGGSGIGPGPVYPGLGSSGGHLTTRPDPSHGSWFGTKVFWYVKPAYRGPVLIRGGRLDGAGSLRFSDSGRDRHSPELRIKRNVETSWDGHPPGSRGEPSGVLIPASGCYGAQIDGFRFSRPVIFTASTP
jgi:hypothetical protein